MKPRGDKDLPSDRGINLLNSPIINYGIQRLDQVLPFEVELSYNGIIVLRKLYTIGNLNQFMPLIHSSSVNCSSKSKL
jgi:hypothetical protein